jgi:hypothetical protein
MTRIAIQFLRNLLIRNSAPYCCSAGDKKSLLSCFVLAWTDLDRSDKFVKHGKEMINLLVGSPYWMSTAALHDLTVASYSPICASVAFVLVENSGRLN